MDFSRVLAGPFAGRMLSDLGADVVKVEPPDGDVRGCGGASWGSCPAIITNKTQANVISVLTCASKRKPLTQVVAAADILIENYRPTMPRLGLSSMCLAK